MKRPNATRGILYAYGGIALPGLVAAFLLPRLIRNLGLARFGLLSLLLSVSLFFTAFDFGVGPAMARYVARLSARDQGLTRLHRLVNLALLLQLAIGLLIGLAFVVLHEAFPGHAVSDAGISSLELNLAVACTAWSVPLAQICGTARCILEGRGRFGVANLLRAPTSVSTFVVPVATSFFTSRLDLITLSLFAARAITALAFLVALHRAGCLSWAWVRLRMALKLGRILLSYGGWVMVGTSAGGLIIMGISDRFLVDRLLGAKSIIVYSLPSDIIVRCLLAPAAIASVLIPLLARCVASGGDMDRIYHAALKLVMNQLGPICLLLAFNADVIIKVLSHGTIGPLSQFILQSMVIGLFLTAVGHVPYSALHAFGRPQYASGRHLVELPVYLGGAFLLLHGGHLGWLGMFWTSWAIVDLLLITFLLHRVAPFLSVGSVFLAPRFLGWSSLLVGSILLVHFTRSEAWRLVLSGSVGIYWGVQLWSLFRAKGLPPSDGLDLEARPCAF